ncbi:hypothetical protein F4818DRAFT_396884 [Hypoxylon cercidicola]|nr:hypothetical protein F4818DRAFT_396884 [Hypoxylon cercidicola]
MYLGIYPLTGSLSTLTGRLRSTLFCPNVLGACTEYFLYNTYLEQPTWPLSFPMPMPLSLSISAYVHFISQNHAMLFSLPLSTFLLLLFYVTQIQYGSMVV